MNAAILTRIAVLETLLLFARHPVTVRDLRSELRRARLELSAVQQVVAS